MTPELKEYRPKRIVNVHRHVDGPWFWDKYSAHPYVGCFYGCRFCYQRGGFGRTSWPDFDRVIKVKTNAAQLLRKELGRLDKELIVCGDWQEPAEKRYRISRDMLKVILELEFPLLIIERSPLVCRDLDIIREIEAKSWAGAIFSLSNLDPTLKHVFEPKSPGVRFRLKAMERLALAGVKAGAALMPILPLVGDRKDQLEQAVKAIKDHGGSFVLAGGLTMSGAQAQQTLAAYGARDPGLEARLRRLYCWTPDNKPAYAPPEGYGSRLGFTVRELCGKYGLRDRMERPVRPGPLAVNKRVAERLFLKTYDLELEQSAVQRIWAYRKAAWTVDEWPESVAELYRDQGRAGLRQLPGIGTSLAGLMAGWLDRMD